MVATVRAIMPLPIPLIINTSADTDHVGSNAAVAAARMELQPDMTANAQLQPIQEPKCRRCRGVLMSAAIVIRYAPVHRFASTVFGVPPGLRPYVCATHINVPKDAAMGHAYTLYPEYRQSIRSTYNPPAECGARAPGNCCGWIERQGLPGGAPNLTCHDGGFGQLGPRGRRASESSSR